MRWALLLTFLMGLLCEVILISILPGMIIQIPSGTPRELIRMLPIFYSAGMCFVLWGVNEQYSHYIKEVKE